MHIRETARPGLLNLSDDVDRKPTPLAMTFEVATEHDRLVDIRIQSPSFAEAPDVACRPWPREEVRSFAEARPPRDDGHDRAQAVTVRSLSPALFASEPEEFGPQQGVIALSEPSV